LIICCRRFTQTEKVKPHSSKDLARAAELWQILAEALKKHALENEVSKMENTPFGIRYVIEGELETPVGRKPKVLVVWFIETLTEVPRLATAYPSKKRK